MSGKTTSDISKINNIYSAILLDPSTDFSVSFCSFMIIFPSWSLLLLDYTYVSSIIHDDTSTGKEKNKTQNRKL